jgi:dihydropteroate synthase
MNEATKLQSSTIFPFIKLRGKLFSLDKPRIIGIININSDSFYPASRSTAVDACLHMAREQLEQGAFILDLGASSSKPGSKISDAGEEWERLKPVLIAIRKEFPEAFISVDSYHSSVVLNAWEEGIDMVNDVSAGSIDAEMFKTVAKTGLPYVLMHMQGTPENMQLNPEYGHIAKEVIYFFAEKLKELHRLGVVDVMLDPGFGFGKRLEQNYQLLDAMPLIQTLGVPIMVGVSRKSMLTKLLGVSAEEALNGTSALHMLALSKGCSFLRVHDVKAAQEVISIYNFAKANRTA